jgi:hypothetical protein
VLGQLGQGLVQHGDVVGGGVGAGVPGSQHPGQGLVGVVQEAQQRVESVSAFEMGCGLVFLVGMDLDQGGVQVEDEVVQPASTRERRWHLLAGDLGAGQPCSFARLRPRRPYLAQLAPVEAGQNPPRRGGRGHGPVQPGPDQSGR